MKLEGKAETKSCALDNYFYVYLENKIEIPNAPYVIFMDSIKLREGSRVVEYLPGKFEMDTVGENIEFRINDEYMEISDFYSIDSAEVFYRIFTFEEGNEQVYVINAIEEAHPPNIQVLCDSKPVKGGELLLESGKHQFEIKMNLRTVWSKEFIFYPIGGIIMLRMIDEVKENKLFTIGASALLGAGCVGTGIYGIMSLNRSMKEYEAIDAVRIDKIEY